MKNAHRILFALLSPVVVGCGSLPSFTDSGIVTGNSCTSDTNCQTGTICHPVLKQCIEACTSSAGCATGLCKRFDGTGGSTYAGGFCQCNADSQCAVDGGTAQVCSTATLRCEAKCTATSCPTGFSCETATGQCKVPMDAGTHDAGTTDAGVSCTTTNAQPDVCGYGNICHTADAKCDAARNDSQCTNIAEAITKGNFSAFSPLSSTGPVIYNVVDEATDLAADCVAPSTPFTVTVFAYAGTSIFPANKSALSGFWYFDATGARTDIALNLLRTTNYTASGDGKTMSAKFTLCGTAGATMLAAGFGFTGGNGYCATLTH